MSDFIYLNVDVPATCAVGSFITVSYEDKYYEIAVPSGGPGNAIQVAIPNTNVNASAPSMEVLTINEPIATAVESNAVFETAIAPAKPPKPMGENTKMAIAAAAGVVVGSLILGPTIVGACVVGGVAYAVHRNMPSKPTDGTSSHVEDGSSSTNNSEPTMMSKVSAAGTATILAARQADEKYQVSSTISATATKAVVAAKETDEKYKITEKTQAAAAAAVVKMQEVDQKYQISAKAGEATQAGVSKLKQLNEEHKVTERATAAAFSLFTSAATAAAKLSAQSSSSSSSSNQTGTSSSTSGTH